MQSDWLVRLEKMLVLQVNLVISKFTGPLQKRSFIEIYKYHVIEY
jgi:hypothetical protein